MPPLLPLLLGLGAGTGNLSMPVRQVEVAFDAQPGDSAITPWTDVTSYVRSISVTRGRQRETDQFQAGRMSVVLDNRDRRFDPDYAAGPYYGKLLPMKPVRFIASYDQAYPVFYGYADGWGQEYDNPNDARCVLECTDGFKPLNLYTLEASAFAQEVRNDAPTHWYRFNEASGSTTITDNVSAGASTLTGAFTFGTTGLVAGDSATAMTGPGATTQKIALPDSVGPTGSQLSVEFWFKGTTPAYDPATSIATYLYNNNVSGANPVAFYISHFDGTLQVIAGPTGIGSTMAVNDNVARHFVFTFLVGGNMTLYVNGVLNAYGGAGTTPMTGGDVAIMPIVGNNPPSRGSSGTMQDLVIYAKELSASRVLAHYNAGTSPWSAEASGTRIGRVLDAVGWPATLRNVDTGKSTLGALSALGGTPLSHAQAVVLTEAGLFFITRDGKVRFISRQSLQNPPYNTSQATYGEREIGYSGIKFGYDDTLIYNRATVSRAGAPSRTASDATSIGKYLTRSRNLTGLLHNTDAKSADRAAYEVLVYKDASKRVESMRVMPQADSPAAFPEVLKRELGDRVTVIRRPQGSVSGAGLPLLLMPSNGTAIVQECIVDGVSHRIEPMLWTTEIRLNRILAAQRFWMLGVAGNSELGWTTRLGF